ncbi:ABC transporter permease [Actinoplanes sp. SE50]|uniref:carbohydrate ABC transporter permease n=1 Tax=unclassified Actinoplanes TaxID=2626549 RepID=UPI00023ED59B|nr:MULTISPECIES: sugar ABC transporter permease [unclassified Actinoplanes]AEV82841.1 putative ABC transporter permease protein yurN [Actinoplanes sp. SE50/110]ATO81237.1 ABC transporter permease [Actinoplanes sp. SE50]SLL98644.1 ABC transporter permease [Actinoplanes sp. SE50/110]
MRHGKYPFIIGFLVVPLALYLTFVVGAYLQMFQLSFTDWSGFGGFKYIGFDNFVKLWDDPVFWIALRHNVFLLIFLPIVTIAIALFFAFLLNVGGRSKGGVTRGIWGSKVYRIIFFFPQLLALAIVAVIFGRVFGSDHGGMLNGLFPSSWSPWLFLADERFALTCILAVLVWQAVGFYVVLFSAGMGNIPQEIYEAAALDGATKITLFFRITLPLLWGTLQVAWVYLGIAAFDAFALVNIMSVNKGGPNNATQVLSYQIFLNAFQNSQAGYASAIGVVLFFLTLTFAALTLRVTRRDAANA